MLNIISKIIANVLTALYQPFFASIVMTILLLFLYLYAEEHGWKHVVKTWKNRFLTDMTFRRAFFLTFYCVMILFRTLFNRNMWANPVSKVLGSWGLYYENGELTTEAIENLVLFIPFTFLLLWTFRDKLIGNRHHLKDIAWLSVKFTFLFSITIEFLQLFLRIGTFQLSDLFYNTLGGLIGGLIYFVGTRKKDKRNITEDQ